MKDASEKIGNMDQIRELTFGSHMREYTDRFDYLESELSTFSVDIRKRIDEVSNTLSNDLHTAIDTLNKTIKSLTLTSKEERTDLQQQVKRTDSKFTTRFESLSEEAESSTNALRNELSQAKGALEEEMRDLKTLILNEINKRFSALSEVKVSKDNMAEILFEVGMKLKGTELIADLQEMVDADEATVIEPKPKGK
jgi:F0F1-type ATP synthase membrane subunit b/b'